MKTNALLVVFALGLLQAQADEPSYRADLKNTRDRFQSLDQAYHDYRKERPGLPAEQEEERLRLLGKLTVDDPVGALVAQLQADIEALVAISPQSPADRSLLESLKDLLALTSELDGRATTRPEAERWATTLRQFIARRDVPGARIWVKSR